MHIYCMYVHDPCVCSCFVCLRSDIAHHRKTASQWLERTKNSFTVYLPTVKGGERAQIRGTTRHVYFILTFLNCVSFVFVCCKIFSSQRALCTTNDSPIPYIRSICGICSSSRIDPYSNVGQV